MPALVHNAIALAQQTVARHYGLTVRYQSGTNVVARLEATPAAVSADVLAFEDLAVRATAQDWLVAADSLTYQGAQQYPHAGDRIVVSDGRGERIYEVVPMGGGSHYEPADAHGLQWRIHSKLLTAEP